MKRERDAGEPDPTPDARAGPLAGIRVVDLTTILLGPLATQIMGDYGADVVKVEAPGGDPLRAVGPPPADGMGAVFMGCNRNKRSIALDLKRDAGRTAMLALLARADVFVHNMRPQAIDRLGLGYDAVRELAPALVYCASYGYRRGGPYGHKPAYDDMIQAASGLASLQTVDGRPRYATSVVADKITAMAVVNAVLAALFHRERSGCGRGQFIEVPMFETMVAFNMTEHLYGQAYEPARGAAGYPRALSPDRRPYRTRDGWIGVLPYSDQQWRGLFAVAGREELAGDPRFRTMADRLAHIDEVYAELAAILATRTSAEWLEKLDAAQVPSMPVNRPDDLVTDPHLTATGFWHTMDHAELGTLRLPGIAPAFSETPASIRRVAPRLGEHSAEVLAEAGYAQSEIAAMLADGAAVAGATPGPSTAGTTGKPA